MAALRTALAILALGSRAFSLNVLRTDDVTLDLEPLSQGFQLVLIRDGERTEYGVIGYNLDSPSTQYIAEEIDGGLQIQVKNVNLTIHTVYDSGADARGVKIKWTAERDVHLQDCIDFSNKHWYAGPMQVNQVYPIENATQSMSAYVSKEDDNGAIVERYWLNSAGEYFYVHPEVALFVDYNNVRPNSLCFVASNNAPYASSRDISILAYDFWILSDVKSAHKHAVANYLGKPSDVPDFRMVQHPIWSTWAQYARDINEDKLTQFATQIKDYGFQNSQFEVDDLWEVCYGSLTVDAIKFPNFNDWVQSIKDMGFRVTIWVHPFINQNCEPWYSEALNNGYLVVNENESPDTSWWNNNGSVPGYVDFTKPAAAEWWYQRVKRLIDEHGIDSLKFDAGESSFSPQIPVQNGSVLLHPHNIVQSYVRTCARFGNMIEVRAGFLTQDLPVFVRMVDRDSIWGLNNGLATVITTTIQMNLNGYTLVLPDMIGGNGLNLDHEQAEAMPSKELFIRWVQLNTFLPAMQYSFVPWNFDNETVEISRKYTEMHASYAEEIYAAMQASVSDGVPVNAPLWWIAPNDAEAQVIWDEYLLGETILVAPVLAENARSRDIYLPEGEWYAEGDTTRNYTGPIWLRDYPAPLDVLPYFVRERSMASQQAAAVVLVVFSFIFNMFRV